MDAISRIWYNGSYTIAAKPIKTLELHYTMIQFLIIVVSLLQYKGALWLVIDGHIKEIIHELQEKEH